MVVEIIHRDTVIDTAIPFILSQPAAYTVRILEVVRPGIGKS